MRIVNYSRRVVSSLSQMYLKMCNGILCASVTPDFIIFRHALKFSGAFPFSFVLVFSH